MESNHGAEIRFLLHDGPRRRPHSELGSGRLPRVTRILALALSFQDIIAAGGAKNYKELARRTGVTAERLSQVMKLLWLAPSIQQEILYLSGGGGRYPLSESMVRSIAMKWSWAEQLDLWSRLKKQLQIETRPAENGEPDALDPETGQGDQ